MFDMKQNCKKSRRRYVWHHFQFSVWTVWNVFVIGLFTAMIL